MGTGRVGWKTGTSKGSTGRFGGITLVVWLATGRSGSQLGGLCDAKI